MINSKLDLKCSSLIEGAQGAMAPLNGKPEMDAYMWVERGEAKKMVYKSQKFMFEENFVEQQVSKNTN